MEFNNSRGSAELSDEVLYDIRRFVGLSSRRYRLLRQLATLLDEVNVRYAPKDIPRFIEEIEGLLRTGTAVLTDTAPIVQGRAERVSIDVAEGIRERTVRRCTHRTPRTFRRHSRREEATSISVIL